MYAVSSEFLQALQSGSQNVVFSAEVLSNNAPIVTDLQLLGGAVQVDATATNRRRCNVVLIDPTGALIPNDANDVLSPYGYEIRLHRGYSFIGGGQELVPIGTFRIKSAKVINDNGVRIELTGFDRSRSVQRGRFETPYAIASGTNYVTAIQTLIASRLPGVMFSSITTDKTTPTLLFDQASDPWKAAQDMARAIGAEVFFDPMGVCVIRNEPNTATDPVTYIYEEGSNSTLLSVENNLDDEPGYNGVVVDGEAAGLTPVHSVVYDSDPTSPTNYTGRYLKVPKFLKTPLVFTQAQGDEVAAAELRREKGGTEQARFSAIPNAAHEGGDVVRLVDPAIGVDGYYLMESFGIPLDTTTAMTPTTRKRRT